MRRRRHAAHSATGRLSGNMASVVALLLCLTCVGAEILTPPYVNLALGKKITATATCGDEGPELYCKLVGANADHNERVIQGQVCDFCDANDEAKKHPPEYAVDGMETWWQSPPLSRGMKYNEINLTIDLGQEFHVAYVFLKMGNSPRPGLWALEKSTDYGKTFKPWQYFSESPQDCERYFGKESLQPITRDDSVICSTEYSKIVPLEGGEIPISLLNYRPSANKYFSSLVLQEWTRATNVRLRLLRTKNLLGHLMSVARQDPTVTRRYFYSIKDISIGGRCMCNGHADNCYPADPESDTSILVCRCQHNTCGPQCAQCCPGFEQKKWRISQYWDRFSCEPCNCHNHTTECEYDPEVDEKHLSLDIQGRYEGGGVCKNCQHNTEGINCNKCRPTFYRPRGKKWGELDVCQPCDCDLHYSTGNCEEETGRCECRKEFNPPFCDSCAYGYFDYPDCKPCTCNLNGTEGQHCTPVGGLCPCKFNYAGHSCEVCADGYYSAECKNCECNPVGSVSQVCDKDSGNCTCKSKYAGRTCNQCEAGYYEYPSCNHCNCDVSGTQPSVCDDVTGQCICKTGFGGARCDQCIAGYYMEVRGRERQCVPCNCSSTGSTSTSCSADGKCNCLANFGGKQCAQCSPGHYRYPECLPCNCDVSGSIGSTCDDNGKCHCKSNFDSEKCDRCKESFYNYPACEECNCDPRGVVASFAGCGSVPAGELCQCKERVQGRICNDCKPLFWNLQEYSPVGCEECGCHLAGTLGGLGACDTRSGQCTCKMHVGERQCDQCQDGFYRLQSNNVFGCTECDCDIGGSIDNNCDKLTGQCRCHSRVEGRRCDRPIRAHYFPTLHQFQYEVEEGLTQSGPVRYRNSEEAFPGYSWKGYVVFSALQNEVINIVHISKSSLYRMVLKYASSLRDPVVASIVVTPESVTDVQQKFTVLLRPTQEPQLITVSGDKEIAPSPFVMNPGNWTVTIRTTKEVMIDYFVLIPEAYYEATVLTKLVDKPCVIGDQRLCRHFAYPSVQGRPTAELVTPVTGYVDDPVQLKELNAAPNTIPLLNDAQPELEYKLNIEDPGPYILLVEYVTPINRSALPTEDYSNETNLFTPKWTVTVRIQSGDAPETAAIANLNECPYTSPCRQVVVDSIAKIYIVNLQSEENTIYLDGERDVLTGIKSVIAIPEDEWHLDYITPRPYCLRRGGKCEPAVFSAAVDSKKVEIESGTGGDREERPPILDNSTAVVYLTPDSDPVAVDFKVPAPGEYMFLVHYYQPDHPESNLDVTLSLDGVSQPALMTAEHCPSNSGCRALLRLPDRDYFPVAENVSITFQGADTKGLWLDYVLAVATADYTDSALKEANVLDYTREFIDKCTRNHYHINHNDTGFCRDAMFSITAEYNSGALSCFCDFMGSTELECDIFGGQCPCRPNVVGRSCTACRTGYYGFPHCRPCHCPATAICDDNGMCICPKNVEGENCDRCKPYTFNFDVHRGCDECNCNPLGVVGDQLQCHPDNGNCACKENVIGRVCDHCVPGHYAFPDCVSCSCDLDGTTDDVCDQNTAQCYCKRHVRGQACNECKEEYFNLQASNPEGCTKCFCFGKTTRCTSSYFAWTAISVLADWTLVSIEANRTLTVAPYEPAPTIDPESSVEAQLGGDKVIYFSAPKYYLGKRLTSYGGYLTYVINYSSRNAGRAVAASDVILGGANGYLIHNSVEQPPSSEDWEHAVKMSEDEFTRLDGSPVTREQFMTALVNVTSLYIRASYWEDSAFARLSVAALEIADEYAEGTRRALSVEDCQCPKAYRGLSCEQCAVGYYRLSSGPHAGLCAPCQCNGHSQECDVNTGVCLDCTHNTMGDHCEQCVIGYHGDATVGTPRDCLICACPMPTAANNFAIGCDLSENGSLISCDCKPGYGGARCEYCAAGYYGVPEVTGDYCKPCNCSGNINIDDPSSCDSITGDCLKCVNNTAGAACNLCAPGFYGDAIFSKNCTACICDLYGMERCDPSTGTCVCRPGVIGEKCDRCAPDHYGLESGFGCTPCSCALAATASQCDPTSGQCKCAKGVTGRHCEQCAAGYWNYTKDGCDHCNCNTGYSVGFMCNATGQCECLPGVIGEKCDRCPERWVLIPQEGCKECDECTDALIFTVEDLSHLLANETQDFKDKADSFFTTQRLNYIANQTKLLRPKVAELQVVHLDDVTAALQTLESSARNMLRSAEFAATDSDKQITRAAELAIDADKTLSSVRDSSDKAKVVVAHVADLATGLELSQQPKADSALAEARQISSDIAEKNLQPALLQSNSVFGNATAQIERMNVFIEPVTMQAKKFERLVNSTHQLKEKLEDLLEFTDLAQHTSAAAEKFNERNRQSKFGNKVLSVTKLNEAAMKDLIDAAEDVAAVANLSASNVASEAARALTGNRDANINMDERLNNLEKDMPALTQALGEAADHANSLRTRADNLRAIAARENNNTRTKDAYSAASAFSLIVTEINDARKAAELAQAADTNATAVNNILNDRMGPTHNRSEVLLARAADALQTVEAGLRPNHTRAEAALQHARLVLDDAFVVDNAIQLSLPKPPAFALQEEIDKADRVNATIRNTLDVMSKFGSDLGASKQWALSLPKLADEGQKMMSNIESYLRDVEATDPMTKSKYRAVKMMQEDLEKRHKEADDKLNKLKELIEQARAVANRVQVGVSFDRRSTLQPRLPDSVDEMSTSTHVSAYFRTKEKDGFLLYLGNPKDTNLRRTNSDDFMVVGIQNGYPYLVMDIGDSFESGREPARIGSDKYVADDRWYQVVVDRLGRNVKLSIRESLDNGSELTHAKEAVLPGQHTIFNLDKEKSKLYVGGVPSDAKLQGISFPAFEGQIEELVIGDTPVGLWNSISSANLKGARQRDKLITSSSGPQEYRFNGKSYVTMPAREYIVPQKNHVLLYFRTYAPNGLIYLVGEGDYFFSVEMQDGAVYLQVSLGNTQEIVINGTQKKYNDGKWHKLDAGRYLANCSLKVDDEILRAVSPSPVMEITAVDTMNFGGNNKGIVHVKNVGFDGCLRQISIEGVNIDLAENIEAIGMGYGCQFASLVSLSGADSYLRYVDLTSDNLQLTLKFRTSRPDGLLFLYVSRMQTPTMPDSVSLSLIKGRLVLMSQREQLDTGLSAYNDSQWHVLTVVHNKHHLRLYVDDIDYFSSDTPPAPLQILEGVLFVGGVQNGYVVGGRVGSKVPFQGCIADATINGRILNLLEPFSSNGVTFGRCGDITSTGGMAPDGPWVPQSPPTNLLPVPTQAPPPIVPEPDEENPDVNRVDLFHAVVTPPTTLAPTVATTTQRPATTTRRPTTTARPPPQPEPGCKLAYDPFYDVGDPEEGYRFGTREDSRIEYGKLPGRQLGGFDLSVAFRTFDRHGGLVLYALADKAPRQYLALYLRNAALNLAFNCGGEDGHIIWPQLYNDTQWHTVTVVRRDGHAKLTVDGERVGEASVECNAPAALTPPYFYGGLRLNMTNTKHLPFYQPFKGCLRGLSMNGQPVSDVRARVNSLRCSDNVEGGVYFGPSRSSTDSNYIKLFKVGKFKVGNEISISMEVKPRNSTGLLLSVHGGVDYMVLELLDDEVVARVENGKGEFQASYKLGRATLCDGNWHRIHAVKSRHVVSIGVDGHFSDAGIGLSSSTDTRYPLYIGGHERPLHKLRGVKAKHGYTGCVRSLVIKEAAVDIPLTAAGRNAHVGVCPMD